MQLPESLDTGGKPQKPFSIWKVMLPVFIGIGAVAFLFLRDAEKENLSGILGSIDIDARVIACLFLGICFMGGRDFGLTWRFRTLADGRLRWGQAWRVCMLCEFTSCVTPSAVGGSSLGMVFLNREGIEFGRATTLMITTLFLDELFFVVACPIVVAFTPARLLFHAGSSAFASGITLTFWLVYAGIALWTFLLFTGILWKPDALNRFLVRAFSVRWLRRWQPKVMGMTANMKATSVELRTKSPAFWLEVFGGTACSWISRYLVVNALFFGFIPHDDPYQWVILARQFVVWVVLMVSFHIMYIFS